MVSTWPHRPLFHPVRVQICLQTRAVVQIIDSIVLIARSDCCLCNLIRLTPRVPPGTRSQIRAFVLYSSFQVLVSCAKVAHFNRSQCSVLIRMTMPQCWKRKSSFRMDQSLAGPHHWPPNMFTHIPLSTTLNSKTFVFNEFVCAVCGPNVRVFNLSRY